MMTETDPGARRGTGAVHRTELPALRAVNLASVFRPRDHRPRTRLRVKKTPPSALPFPELGFSTLRQGRQGKRGKKRVGERKRDTLESLCIYVYLFISIANAESGSRAHNSGNER
jgi:hypothetical protein